ncbi:hypothetical protein PENSPDRAFT_626588 [Peniophora sp. CONT]|nr:hypothetical protein PENSPDRAFT_626588 [Peniophora sp. CONT]
MLTNAPAIDKKSEGNVEKPEPSTAGQEMARASPDDDFDREGKHRVAIAMFGSYLTSGKLEDLVKAVKGMHEVVGAALDSTNGEHLSDFGGMLLTLHVRLGKLSYIELAILALARAIELTPDTHPDKPGRLSNLGASLEYRFQRLGELDDLENSIAAHRRGIELSAPDTLDAGQLTNLGASLTKLFHHNGALDVLEEAISVHRRAVELTPDNHPNKAAHLNNLGTALHSRFERVDDLRDLEDCIASHRRAVELVQSNDPYKPTFLNNLSTSLLARFERIGDLEDIDAAISVAREALGMTPDGDPFKATYLKDLSASLLRRFKRNGALEDLESSISTARRAVDLTSDDDIKRPGFCNSLGAALMARFENVGELDDLEDAILTLRHAVELSLDGRPDKPNRLSNMGNALQKRFKRFGRVEDIDAAISALRSAVDLTPDDGADKPAQLNNLAIGLETRFGRLDELEDLDAAIIMHHRAIELTPDGHPDKSRRLHNLGIALQRRFDRIGDLSDLNSAIAAKQDALQLMPDDQPGKSSLLHSLGNSLQSRFERLGDISDLNSAISGHRHAAEATPDSHPLKPSFLNSLGGALQALFARTGDVSALDGAIAIRAQAVKLTPDGHPDMPLRLNSFGISLHDRYEETGELSDLDIAITVKRRAVELTPDDHPSKPSRLNNLGNSLQRRYAHTGELTDLESAISAARLAVQLTPDGHRDKLEMLYNLGGSLRLLFEHTKARADFDAAIDCLLSATRQPLGNPYHRIPAANRCVELLSTYPEFSSTTLILEAHSRILDTLPGVVWLGHSVTRRYEESARLGDLVNAAVSAAIEAGALSQAVEWLEAGRSLVWSQILSLRTPLSELEDSHPVLAQSLRAVQEQLQQSGYASSVHVHEALAAEGPVTLPRFVIDASTDRHRHLVVEYERLLAEVRVCSGFEDFLRPQKLPALVASLESIDPIVFINVHSTRCDAIVLAPGGTLKLIPLPDLSLEGADKLRSICTASLKEGMVRDRGSVSQNALRRQTSPFRRLAELMWTWVVDPILKSLDLTIPTYDNLLPRIIWCPTGPLTQLPLHAAGVYNDPSGPRLFNSVVSSYIPSLSAYVRCSRAEKQRSVPRVLIVTQPETAGLSPLPGTRAESRCLLEVLDQWQVARKLFDHDQATVATIQRVLNQHSWVHLACHGSQDQDDPTRSAFALYDGPLSLSDLMRTAADDVELAFLSACQTATGDDDNTEESAHLAAGMLAVGFKGVVATMWSIGDEEAPMVVEAYYRKLLELRRAGELRKGETGAAYALHEAVKVLREKVGEKNFVKWAPFIHIGA